MADYLKLDIQVAALCNAKPGDDLCQCRRYEADKGDEKPCRWLVSTKAPAGCRYYEGYINEAKDYLERLFKAHVARPEQPAGINPTKRRSR